MIQTSYFFPEFLTSSIIIFPAPNNRRSERNRLLKSCTNLAVLEHFPPCGIFELGSIRTFLAQKEDKKIVKICKDLEPWQVFIYDFLCENVLIFLRLFTKRSEKFWSRTISSTWDIRTF